MTARRRRPRRPPGRDPRGPDRLLQGLPADPEHLRATRPTPTTAVGPRRGWPTRCETAGIEHVEVAETGGHPVVYGDWLHADGAPTSWSTATTTSSPSTRSTCGPRRRSSRSWSTDRMLARGAADDKGQIHLHVMAAAAHPRDARRVPGERPLRLRGRGGVVSSVHLDAGWSANAGAPDRRRRDHQRQRVLRGQHPGHHGRPARDLMYAQIDVVGEPRRPPFGRLSAAPSRTRRSPSPGSSPRSRVPTAGS